MLKIFAGSNQADNEKLNQMLGKTECVVIGVPPIVENLGWVLLPFVEAENGARYYGLDSIKRFLGTLEVA